ncbi:MAG: DUF4876 domain-containing protein [Dysgonamonadaceae bacterium]|jgi:hypothetical protein|nr:DUF4876 domain-containing protein [Dysgonamonadaceae bacterium]
MMKVRVLNFLLVLTGVLVYYSCSNDDGIATSSTEIKFNHPEGLENSEIKQLTLTLKEKNTGNEIVTGNMEGGIFKLTVPQGLYDISAEGTISYKAGEDIIEGKVKGFKESVGISQNAWNTEMDLFLYDVKSGLIFEEIFFTGTQTPESKQYRGDSYFKIYNNSDDVIYADGYVIAESKFLTVTKYDYRPDIMNEAFASSAVYMIPGSGSDVPVEPGKSIIICDQAINHLELNSNSFDLSSADFEWYDETSSSLDTDNPAIPNLLKVYSESKTIWIPHNQGNKSYVLAKLGVNTDQFIADYKYDYEYDTSTRVMTGTAYKIPNNWIVDAVNISNKSTFEWIVTTPSLDMGWSYCAEVSGDNTRYGKSIQRKVLSITEDGRNILQDTNNSTVDLIPRATPSLKK